MTLTQLSTYEKKSTSISPSVQIGPMKSERRGQHFPVIIAMKEWVVSVGADLLEHNMLALVLR